MASKRIGRVLAVLGALALSAPIVAVQQRSDRDLPLADFDARAGRPPAAASAPAIAELNRAAASARGRGVRLHPHTGAVRVLDAPGLDAGRRSTPAAVRGVVASAADRLGLERGDLESLQIVRDYTSASTGLRHLVYEQSLDGIRVFDAMLGVHLAADGNIVRLTSGAARRGGRAAVPVLPASAAIERAAQAARGPGRASQAPSLVWFPADGDLLLAWHTTVDHQDGLQLYDVLIDAATGELLLRRNRILFAEGSGRVLQSASTQLRDPRLPDPMPSSATSCPPPLNYELRNLTAPFRDAASVLSGSGRLEGNNTQVLRGNLSTPAAAGTFDGSGWLFDFSFNTAGAAETSLFFALNFAHDFFYDLGFDEAAGNYQASNFNRGGVGGDRIRAVARAAGRNNATFQPAPEGASPIISMFLWDGTGCWAADVDGDGLLDLDGDYDLDIILHEFHHGVSHRLNTAFTGPEADAIGEGASDFFAYSVNGDSTLAEYSRPGGLRAVNEKTYGDWLCFFGLFCEPHANGEIFANVLWDVRERFRTDLVRGSEAAAVNESHQLYVDALKLSPPAPTMLDIRDAMLQADALRNPGSPQSQNFCRIWEEFAGRGMGLHATDTADSGGSYDVGPDVSVPSGCDAPPPPPTVTLTVVSPTASEADGTAGVFRIGRSAAASSSLAVSYSITGTAARGSDYENIATSAMIPAGALFVDVPIVPIDDTTVEGSETVTLGLRTSSSYVVGSPASGTVTIVSDDTAPDLAVSSVVAPATAGAGAELQVSDVTKNQGTGASPASVTSFYLSPNSSWDAADRLLGTRDVPALAVGATDAGATTMTVPADVTTGSYYVIAKADGTSAIAESNEANNTRADLVKVGPDLTVSALSVPSTAGQGGTITVTETTKNSGAGASGASVTRFFLSTNTSVGDTDTPLGDRAVSPLAAGASSGATTTLAIPGSTPSGTYYVIAAADADGTVVETSDANNVRYSLVRIGPDLQVSSLSAPSRVVAGSVIAVTDTTKNAGQALAGASTTAFYLSTNATVSGTDMRLAESRAVGALAAGGLSSGTTNVTLPVVGAGQWYLVAAADDGGAITETFEVNNERAVLLHFGPDLDVTSVTAPSTAVAGATIGVSATVKNLGAETAPASTTRFYLSANTAFDATDTPLGERAVPALGQNASDAGAATLMLPAGVTGRFYILAVADGSAAIAESSESNNTLARVITINP